MSQREVPGGQRVGTLLAPPAERAKKYNPHLDTLQVVLANGTPWMPQALQLMVDGYFPYIPAYHPSEAEEKYRALQHLLCDDPYEPLQRSFTFVALLPDRQEPSHLNLIGTMRLTCGKDDEISGGLPAIPALHLLSVTPNWPHRLESSASRVIGEFGRFCIEPAYRRLAVQITYALTRAINRKALELAVDSIYSIMPQKVLRITDSLAMPFRKVSGIAFLETEHAHRYFDALPGYWEQLMPILYRLPVEPEEERA